MMPSSECLREEHEEHEQHEKLLLPEPEPELRRKTPMQRLRASGDSSRRASCDLDPQQSSGLERD